MKQSKPRRRRLNPALNARIPCPICGRSVLGRYLATHCRRMHTYDEGYVEALDALEDIFPGVPEFRRTLRDAIKHTTQIAELERIYKLPSDKPSSRKPPNHRTRL